MLVQVQIRLSSCCGMLCRCWKSLKPRFRILLLMIRVWFLTVARQLRLQKSLFVCGEESSKYPMRPRVRVCLMKELWKRRSRYGLICHLECVVEGWASSY